MKGEPLLKESPEVPSSKRYSSEYYRDISSFKERNSNKYAAKYDTFHGILKRVSDMKFDGSLDSEEPSTESEKSASSRPSKCRSRSESSSLDETSDCCATDDVRALCLCYPYEEDPTLSPKKPSLSIGVSRASGPRIYFQPEHVLQPPTLSKSRIDLVGFRLGGSGLAGSRLATKESEYRDKRQSAGDIERRWTSDVNENCTDFCEGRLPSEENRSPEGINEFERHQLEVFFRGLKTEIFVCGSLANLYYGWQGGDGKWTYRHTGAIVVILDCGETKSRNKRKIQIVLAERGTCFPLWRDTIDNLSAYHQSGTAFHTMHLSSDHRQIVGLSFDLPSEAEKLIKRIEEWTSNPENINISVPGSAKKKSKAKKKVVPLPHKKNISNPCLFEHVTSVAACDKTVYMSLRTLIDDENIKMRQNAS